MRRFKDRSMTTEPKSVHVETDIHDALRERAHRQRRPIRAIVDAILRRALKLAGRTDADPKRQANQ
jgi:hypothetical protein